MNPTTPPPPTRRVTVVLSGGEDTQTLTTLGLVVAEVGSEVAGLFLEDEDLFRLAELPLSHEVTRLAARLRPLRVAELERQFRVKALQAERTLQSTAERAGLRWSFRRVRARLGAVLDEARDAELLLLGAYRRPAVSAADIRALYRQPRAGVPEMRPVVVLFDGSEGSSQALSTAIRVANATEHPLDILLWAPDPDALEGLRDQAEAVPGAQRARFTAVAGEEFQGLLGAVRARRPALLVVVTGEPPMEAHHFDELRRGAGCPMLVLRP